MIVSDRERELNRSSEVPDFNLIDVSVRYSLIVIVKVDLEDVHGNIVRVIQLEGVDCILDGLRDEFFVELHVTIFEIGWRDLNKSCCLLFHTDCCRDTQNTILIRKYLPVREHSRLEGDLFLQETQALKSRISNLPR